MVRYWPNYSKKVVTLKVNWQKYACREHAVKGALASLLALLVLAQPGCIPDRGNSIGGKDLKKERIADTGPTDGRDRDAGPDVAQTDVSSPPDERAQVEVPDVGQPDVLSPPDLAYDVDALDGATVEVQETAEAEIDAAYCGDGICTDEEGCDGCPQDCGPCCGNGECDGIYGENADTCPGDCEPICGDGIIQPELLEQCDDGNNEPDDGCDEECSVEPEPAEPGDIVITEIMKDPVAAKDSEGEWFEIHNATDDDINLNGWLLMDEGADVVADVVEIFDYDGVVVPAGAYFILATNGDYDLNGGVGADYVYGEGFNLANKEDEVILKYDEIVVDQVAYDNGLQFPDAPGKSMSLDLAQTDAASNDLGAAWCDATTIFGKGDYGSPGQANAACPKCGDGNCDSLETQCSCPEDCGNPCAGKECGEDGCGGSCGGCGAGFFCSDGTCAPWCPNGECDNGENCCTCPDDCGSCCGNNDCDCGEDMCSCPADCGDPCQGKECGDDGCGGSCSECEAGNECSSGHCVTDGFAYIAAGSFWMGSPDGNCPSGYPAESCIYEPGRYSNEKLHYVALTHDFEMQATEVTQGEWKAAFGGWNPSPFPQCGDTCPVVTISWYDSLAYANWKSDQVGLTRCYVFSGVECWGEDDPAEGSDYEFCLDGAHGGIHSATVDLAAGASTPYDCEGYRLPMEAEWEFAARAGSLTAFYLSDGNDGSITYTQREPLDPNLDQIGWYGGNSKATYNGAYDCSGWYEGSTTCGPQPVGGKEANGTGLKDMIGSVSEWCWDRFCAYNTGYGDDPDASSCLGSERVGRGGSWGSHARASRSASRYYRSPGFPYVYLGCRIARSLEFCGDGECKGTETCDSCPEDCGECSICGDGAIDAGEECDDGNDILGDGCAPDCTVEGYIPDPGDVIISEVMQNPAEVYDTMGEYIELYNTRDFDIDINEWDISDTSGDMHTILGGGFLVVPAKGYLVLGVENDPDLNGGVAVAYEYSGILLGNGSDEIIVSYKGAISDEVNYDGGPLFPDPKGASMNLAPQFFNHLQNDIGSSWCESVSPLPSGDKGTPGQANAPCN